MLLPANPTEGEVGSKQTWVTGLTVRHCSLLIPLKGKSEANRGHRVDGHTLFPADPTEGEVESKPGHRVDGQALLPADPTKGDIGSKQGSQG